jgi:hypothetical protein
MSVEFYVKDDARARVLRDVHKVRCAQEMQSVDPWSWVAHLAGQLGVVSTCAIAVHVHDADPAVLRQRLIELAAVAVAAVEDLDERRA